MDECKYVCEDLVVWDKQTCLVRMAKAISSVNGGSYHGAVVIYLSGLELPAATGGESEVTQQYGRRMTD